MKYQTVYANGEEVVTNKYKILHTPWGAVVSPNEENGWMKAISIKKDQLDHILPYKNIKELLQYPDEYVNSRIEKYLNILWAK